MQWLWLLLIPYCTLAFGVHGGELFQNINRQVRNLICAAPFAVTSFYLSMGLWSFFPFLLSYLGSNLGFDWFPTTGWKYYAGLAVKGFVTCPLGGFITLPFAYFIGNKTRWTNVFAEYFSGTLYGVILLCVALYSSS